MSKNLTEDQLRAVATTKSYSDLKKRFPPGSIVHLAFDHRVIGNTEHVSYRSKASLFVKWIVRQGFGCSPSDLGEDASPPRLRDALHAIIEARVPAPRELYWMLRNIIKERYRVADYFKAEGVASDTYHRCTEYFIAIFRGLFAAQHGVASSKNFYLKFAPRSQTECHDLLHLWPEVVEGLPIAGRSIMTDEQAEAELVKRVDKIENEQEHYGILPNAQFFQLLLQSWYRWGRSMRPSPESDKILIDINMRPFWLLQLFLERSRLAKLIYGLWTDLAHGKMNMIEAFMLSEHVFASMNIGPHQIEKELSVVYHDNMMRAAARTIQFMHGLTRVTELNPKANGIHMFDPYEGWDGCQMVLLSHLHSTFLKKAASNFDTPDPVSSFQNVAEVVPSRIERTGAVEAVRNYRPLQEWVQARLSQHPYEKDMISSIADLHHIHMQTPERRFLADNPTSRPGGWQVNDRGRNPEHQLMDLLADKPLTSRGSFHLQVITESFSAYLDAASPAGSTVNCRVKSLRFANEVKASLNELQEHMELCTTHGPLSQFASFVDSYLAEKRSDAYYQSPWVMGSHMAKLLQDATASGLQLHNCNSATLPVLHLYNALVQRSYIQSKDFAVFEAISNAIGEGCFIGERPTRDFLDNQDDCSYGPPFARHLNGLQRAARHQQKYQKFRDEFNMRNNYAKTNPTRIFSCAFYFNMFRVNPATVQAMFGLKIQDEITGEVAKRSEELHNLYAADPPNPKTILYGDIPALLERIRPALRKDFHEGVLPIARINWFKVSMLCSKLLTKLGMSEIEHIAKNPRHEVYAMMVATLKEAKTSTVREKLLCGRSIVDSALLQLDRIDQGWGPSKKDLAYSSDYVKSAVDTFDELAKDLKPDDFLWNI